MEPTPEYCKHWEKLNDLEQVFSTFYTLRDILQSAANSNSPDKMKDCISAALSYFDWASGEYDSCFKETLSTLAPLKKSVNHTPTPNHTDILKDHILEVLDRPDQISKSAILGSLKFRYPSRYSDELQTMYDVENTLDEMVNTGVINYTYRDNKKLYTR